MNCLLVDDEPGIREGLAALLRRQGHVVRTAADCASAREALAGDFDVVVTDWRLPDGIAATFVGAARAPVVVVSGHPEEVDTGDVPCAVMTKPVAPRELIAKLNTLVAPRAAAPATPAPLPVDVQDALAEFRDSLPTGTAIELRDDGVFVTAIAPLAASAARPSCAHGDLRVVGGERPRAELRLHRDGRPAPAVPVVVATAPWPATHAFAVDFQDTRTSDDAFLAAIERAAALAAAGVRVQFLNVPRVLRDATAGHGRAHVMPMRDPVGPRLPAELADLWRDS